MSQIQPPSQLPQRIFDVAIADGQGFCKNQIWQRIFQVIATPAAIPQYLFGTHADRAKHIASDYQDGTIYHETDRGVFYIVEDKSWLYLAGQMTDMQSKIPSDLTDSDVGFLFAVTDFDHLLRWNGTAFDFAPGDGGSGYTAAFITAVPQNGWAACNGAANVPYLDSTGILLNTNVPNTPGTYFRQ